MALLYVLLVAILNMAAGVALAVYAGHRYHELSGAGRSRPDSSVALDDADLQAGQDDEDAWDADSPADTHDIGATDSAADAIGEQLSPPPRAPLFDEEELAAFDNDFDDYDDEAADLAEERSDANAPDGDLSSESFDEDAVEEDAFEEPAIEDATDEDAAAANTDDRIDDADDFYDVETAESAARDELPVDDNLDDDNIKDDDLEADEIEANRHVEGELDAPAAPAEDEVAPSLEKDAPHTHDGQGELSDGPMNPEEAAPTDTQEEADAGESIGQAPAARDDAKDESEADDSAPFVLSEEEFEMLGATVKRSTPPIDATAKAKDASNSPEPSENEADEDEWMKNPPVIDTEGTRPLAAGDLAEATPRELHPARVILEHFAQEVLTFHETTGRQDATIRAMATADSADADPAPVAELRDLVEAQVEACGQLCQTLRTLEGEQPDMAPFAKIVFTAVDKFVAKTKVAIDILNRFEKERDRSKALIRLLGQNAKVLAANHNLFDSIDIALGVMAGDDDARRHISEEQRIDSATGLLNRTGLRGFFTDYRTQPETADKPLGLSMIDIDDLTKINEQFGQNVGDRLIVGVARLLDARKHPKAIIGRLTGQQFALLYRGIDDQVTTSETDRLRQCLEKARFYANGQELRATASALVLEGDDRELSVKALYDRAVALLMQGKRQNPNRTYLAKSNGSSLVIPPKYLIEEVDIEI